MADFLEYVFRVLFLGDPNHPRDHGALDRWGESYRGLYWLLFVVGMLVCWWAAKHWGR